MTKIKTTHPKYQQIGEQLISRILNLEYHKGQLLPTEKELCESFAISRHTAREALRYVEKTGLVERRQGSGTSVIRNTMPERINQFVSSVKDLLRFGSETRFEVEVSDIIKLDGELAELLDAQNDQDCIHIGGVRIEPHDQKPICYSNIYRIPHSDNIDEQLKNKKTAVYAVVEALDANHIGKIEQEISACLMPQEHAEVLKTKADSAAMKITRRYFSKDHQDLILVAESIYPANRFSYSTVLYPN